MTTKIDLTNIADTALTTLTGPKVTTIVYSGDDTATDTAGGAVINLTGNGFQSGCSVLIAGVAASVVSFINATRISFVAPALAAGTYVIYVINPDGGTAISIPGISYSGTPNWTTAAGTLGTVYETGSISATLAATGDAPVTYALATGTLPPGSTLNSDGTLSGTAQATASATTYSFTIKASDAQNQDTNRAFSITINPDVVTFNTPTDSTTYNVFKDAAIANVAMSATSAAGGSITYTADTLPTGLSISGANIQGTPTVVASTTTVLTATSTATRTATRTINWVVSIANDTFWKNTTLLLNGETSVTPFISDASTNNFGLTINGDTRSDRFSPYYGDGYYSNYFDGTGDYLTTPTVVPLTGNFTIEGWLRLGTLATRVDVFMQNLQGSSSEGRLLLGITSANAYKLEAFVGGTTGAPGAILSSTVIQPGTWYHFAYVRNSNTFSLYINGVREGTQPTGTISIASQAGTIGYNQAQTTYMNGYLSNFRICNSAVYTSNFTPSTTPLTAISGTSLLTCQSNRLIDKSTNNFTITRNGDVSVSPAIPFAANSSYATYGSAYFDGTGDYLTTTEPAVVASGTDVTIECWVYPTSILARNFLISAGAVAVGCWAISIETSGAVGIWADGYSAPKITSTSLLSLNQWYHIALVKTSGTIYAYINGTRDAGTYAQSGSFGQAQTITIGAYNVNKSQLTFGYIADVRYLTGTSVYTGSSATLPTQPLTAVTNTQLLALQYNGGANNSGFIDNSNFNNIITRVGNTSQGTFSPYSQTGWSNYFDGTGDYLSTASTSVLNIIGDFTIECWVNFGEVPAGYKILLSGASGGQYFGLIGANTFEFYSGDPNIGLVSTTGTFALSTFSTNQWYHFAVCRTGSSMSVYCNGVRATLSTGATNTGNGMFNAGPIIIGGYASNTAYSINGYISNFRVVSGTCLYTGASFTPPSTPLTPIPGTKILTCQSNRLIDNSPNNFAITKTGDISVQAFSPFGSISEATPLSYSTYIGTTVMGIQTPASSLTNIIGTSTLSSSSTFTIESWIHPLARHSGGAAALGFVAGSMNITGANADWGFGPDSTGKLTVWWYNGSIIVQATSTNVVPLNAWTHIATTISSGAIKIFINGVQETLTGTTTVTTVSSTLTYFTVGGYTYGSTTWKGFNGYISNLRVVKSALYSNSFTPSTTPLTAIANTSLLIGQTTTLSDSSSNAYTLTVTNSVRVSTLNPFGYTPQLTTSYTPSLHGGSAYFDGTGDYLTLAGSSATNLGASTGTSFTVEAWVYPTVSKDTTVIGCVGSVWRLALTPANLVSWVFNTSSVQTSTDTVKLNQWNHIAFTYDGLNSASSNKMFVNGVVQSSQGQLIPPSNTAGVIYVGRNAESAAWDFQGYIADARVIIGVAAYTTSFVPPTIPLTATTSSSLLLNFTNGGIVDQHSSNVLETVGNAQLSTSVKKYNSASMYFDGSGDYLRLPTSPNYDLSGDFTVECWINPTALSTNRMIIDRWASGNAAGWQLYWRATGTSIAFFVGAVMVLQDPTGGTIPTGSWTHVAVTRSGTTARLFINGTIVNTNASFSTNLTNTLPIGVGMQTSTVTNDFNGYIDDLRITKGVARYTSNFTAPTTALITK